MISERIFCELVFFFLLEAWFLPRLSNVLNIQCTHALVSFKYEIQAENYVNLFYIPNNCVGSELLEVFVGGIELFW